MRISDSKWLAAVAVLTSAGLSGCISGDIPARPTDQAGRSGAGGSSVNYPGGSGSALDRSGGSGGIASAGTATGGPSRGGTTASDGTTGGTPGSGGKGAGGATSAGGQGVGGGTNSGGAPSTGGGPAAGGSDAAGGEVATGATSGSGGSPAAGGGTSTGGAAIGGTSNTAGSAAGGTGTGGSDAAGGEVATGATSGSGGSPASGGTTAGAGALPSGGATNTGGANAAGASSGGTSNAGQASCTPWGLLQKVVPNTGRPGERFGHTSFAISDEALLVGAFRDSDIAAEAGAAYVFTRGGNSWSELQELRASDGAVGDYFGRSVSISGDTAIVGAYGRNDQGSNAGAAYVFARSGVVWSEQQKLLASDGVLDDYFGYSVVVDASTAMIGAYQKDAGIGAAYVFVRNESIWVEQQKLQASDPEYNSAFGWSIALSGDTAIIGKNGAAYVFVRSGSTWSEQQRLSVADAGVEYFGLAVALSGDTAVIGSYGDNDAGTDSGSAFVFVRSGTVWTRQQRLVVADGLDGDYLGRSVSVVGDTALIGAPGKDDGNGAAYVFSRANNVWSEQQKLVITNDPWGRCGLGTVVNLTVDALYLGPCGDDTYPGAVFSFCR